MPIRGRLVIIDPRNGLLVNDTEADGDAFTLDLDSVTQPANGSVSVNANGTFTYTNLSNSQVGETDTFTYRLVDSDGRSEPVEVIITLTASTLQNPRERLDVSADGKVSPLDALRVVNLLNRHAGGSASIPIRDLPPPPDYFDVDGSGSITPLDALLVINALNRQSLPGGEGERSVDIRTAVSTEWVSAGTLNLPQSGFVVGDSGLKEEPAATLSGAAPADGGSDMFGSMQVVDSRLAGAIDALVDGERTDRAVDVESTDMALADIWGEIGLESFGE